MSTVFCVLFDSCCPLLREFGANEKVGFFMKRSIKQEDASKLSIVSELPQGCGVLLANPRSQFPIELGSSLASRIMLNSQENAESERAS